MRTRLIKLSAVFISALVITIFWVINRADRADDPSPSESTIGSSRILPSSAVALTDTTKVASSSGDAKNPPPAQFRPALPPIPVLPPIVVPIEWPDEPIYAKVIAAEAGGPSFALLDFTEKVMKIYPPEHHHLFGPLDDAMFTSQGDLIALTSQTVFFLPDADLSNEPIILRPSKSITLPGFPAHLEVLPDRSGSSLWIAQTSNKRRETLLDRIDIETGEPLGTVVIEDDYTPVGLLDEELVLLGQDQVLLANNDGTIKSVRVCHDRENIYIDLPYIVAADSKYVVCLTDNWKRLLIVDVETDDVHSIETPVTGLWVPFDFPGLLDINSPMITRSDSLIIGLIHDVTAFYPFTDMDHPPLDKQEWSLYEITLDDHNVHLLTEGKGRMPKGVHLGNEENPLAVWQWPDSRIHRIDRKGPENMYLVTHMPENHTVYDAAIIAR